MKNTAFHWTNVFHCLVVYDTVILMLSLNFEILGTPLDDYLYSIWKFFRFSVSVGRRSFLSFMEKIIHLPTNKNFDSSISQKRYWFVKEG